MALQGRQKNGVPRLDEGRRLKELFECIPRTTGVFKTTKVILTCLDAGEELLIIGSDAGTVFVYEKNRKRTGMLPSQGRNNSVSCLKLYEPKQRVAFGCVSGNVFFFRLHLQTGLKLQTVSVSKGHLSAVTCLAWHGDGEFLISGDEQGKILISSIDFTQNQCKVQLLHQADSAIVQLSAGVAENWIVVSTMEKSFLLSSHLHLRKEEPIKIGQQDRSGPFGARLWGSDKNEVLAYVARPGLRLWKANLQGKVFATLQYRDLLSSGQGPIIQMYTVHSPPSQHCVDDGQFRHLQLLANKYIVTHCDKNLWVLDPDNNTVLGCHCNLGRLVDVATTETEIFVLREDAECPILLITFHPDTLPVIKPPKEGTDNGQANDVQSLQPQAENGESGVVRTTDQPPEHQKLGSHIGDQVDGQQTTTHIPVVVTNEASPVDIDVDRDVEDVITRPEQTPEDKLLQRAKHDSIGEKAEKREAFQEISQSSFSDDIVFNPKKGRKKPKQKKKSKKAPTVPHGDNREPEIRKALTSTEDIVSCSRETSPPLSDDSRWSVCSGDNVKISIQLPNQSESSSFLSVATFHRGTKSPDDFRLVPEPGRKSPFNNSGRKSPISYQRDVVDSLSGRNSPVDEDHKKSPISETGAMSSLSGRRSPMLRAGSPLSSKHPSDASGPNSPVDFSDRKSPVSECDKLSPDEFVGRSPRVTSRCSSGRTSPFSDEKHHIHEREQASHVQSETGDVTDGSHAVAMSALTGDTSDTDRFSPEQENQEETSELGVPSSENLGEVDMGFSIYDKFRDSESSPGTSENHIEVGEDGGAPEKSGDHEHSLSVQDSSVTMSSSLTRSPAMVDTGDQRLMDGWTPYSYPSKFHINCAALSNTRLFVIDSTNRPFMAKVGETSGKWRKIDGYLKQISVSPNGLHILGLSSRHNLYVRLGVTSSNPAGRTWDKTVDDIMGIAVEDTQMWCLRRDGSVVCSFVVPVREKQKPRWYRLEDALRQKLSFVQVTACKGVVWARDKAGSVYYRAGITPSQRQGNRWKIMGHGMKASHICLGGHQAGWAVSTNGTVLFKQGVTPEKPAGEPRWWEIQLSDYRVEDASLLTSLWSWVKPTDSSLKLVVANAEAGVCVLTGSSSIHLSNTALLGSNYEIVNLQGIPQSATNWSCVAAGSLSSPTTGLVWGLRRNGEIFCLPPNGRPFSIDPPSSARLTLLTASEVAVWALVGDKVVVREGINSYCPQGISWKKADTITMDNAPVKWLSCGRTTVWAVDQIGHVWLRMVTDPTQHGHSSPVWLEIDGQLSEGFPLQRVAVAPDDSMVWVVDQRGNVYVRNGVTESLPTGKQWEYVAGAQVKELVVSKTSVWAISASGEMLCRFGMSRSNCSGDYWKKVIGSFSQLSVTPFDQVWGIDKDGQMFLRHTVAYAGSQFTVSADSLSSEGWDVI